MLKMFYKPKVEVEVVVEPKVDTRSLLPPSQRPAVLELVVMQSLDHFFSKAYLDVCIITNAREMLNVQGKSKAHEMLRTLHCMHYDKMDKELVKIIPELVKEALTSASDLPAVNLNEFKSIFKGSDHV